MRTRDNPFYGGGMMTAKITQYQKFDPDTDYEIDDGPEPLPEAIECCRCVEAEVSLCNAEGGAGMTVSSAAAQTFVYWGTWS